MRAKYLVVVPLLLSCVCSAIDLPDHDRDEPKNIDQIVDDFFECLNSPSRLFLSIEDDESLAKALKDLELANKKIDALIVDMQRLEVPGDKKKKKIEALMSARQSALDKKIGEGVKKHRQEMPRAYRDSWTRALSEFYKKVYAHDKVLTKYLELDKKNR